MRRSTLLVSTLAVTVLACATVASEERARHLADTAGIEIPSADDGIPGVAAPMSLTASDGTGLKLVSVTANASIEDPLAFTELTMVFENPLDRQLEGQFKITLPQDASLSRFAMKIDDRWQEGEVVEKQAARRAYEDFLHRKQDPALLEQGGGNEFAARVFPIPPRGRKEIVLSYSETLKGTEPYVLPLRGLPKLEELDIKVQGGAGSGGPKTFYRRDFSPARDFVLGGKSVARNAAIMNEKIAVARVVPFSESRPEPVEGALVLVDTSASRALDLEAGAKLLQGVLAKLPGDTRLTVHAFDEDTAPIFDGEARAYGDAETQAIVSRRALGASNLELALTRAKTLVGGSKAKKRVILVTDGVTTVGETDSQKLAATVESLTGAGVERLDAIAVGSVRDDAFLRRITGKTLPKSGVVLAASRGPEEIARRLGEATSRNVPVSVEGARWTYPKLLDGLQSGDEVLVYAELSEERPLVVSAAGQTHKPLVHKAERPLLERTWAKAKIESLVAAPLPGGEDETKKAIVALSTKHRVMSPHTSFLVLETEADYARFNIDRRSKLDILTIADGRVVTTKRSRSNDPSDVDGDEKEKSAGTRARGEEGSARDPHLARQAALRDAQEFGTIGLLNTGAGGDPNAPTAPWGREEGDPMSARGNMWGDSIGDAFGAGGLGLTGVGEGGGGQGQGFGGGGTIGGARQPGSSEGIGLGSIGTLGHGAGTGTGQGFGSGHGRLGGAHATHPPRIRQGATQVSGRLPPEVIQRIVRQNFGRFRLCYENGLRRNPNLQGRVAVRFIIDRSGAVASTSNGGSDLPDSAVVSCVARAFMNLSFPQPEGGVVVVTYPIMFDPGDGPPPPFPTFRSSPEPPGRAPQRTFVRSPDNERVGGEPPYEGKMKDVMTAIGAGNVVAARDLATSWQRTSPTDVLALVALGETAEKSGDRALAQRSYASIVDLFGFRADSRRFAGARLERLGDTGSIALATDIYAKAVEQRPDHPAGHRLLAYAWLKQKQFEKAFEACRVGLERNYPEGRFAGVKRILAEDLGLIAAAWKKAEPARSAEIDKRLEQAHGTKENGPSLRFVLNWETDANDVDFHIRDAQGGHAYYGSRTLGSGGELYADVTTGYGPECFTIRTPKAQRPYPYRLEAHYFARGPMGYGMGKLQVIEHDGDGTLTFDERPYVVMVDRAYVDLGRVEK